MSGLVVDVDDALAVVRGLKAGQRLKASGMKAVYSAAAGGWMLDAKRLPDLLAYLQSRSIGVDVRDAGGPGDAA